MENEDKPAKKLNEVEEDLSNYAEATDTEESTAIVPMFTDSGSKEEVLQSRSDGDQEKLKPKFAKSCPVSLLVHPKGLSKTNLAKGKRPRILPLLGSLKGDLLTGMSMSKITSYDRQWYDHAIKSQITEKFNRTKNTLVTRIEEMNQKNLISLVDVYKIFQIDNTPIAMSMSQEMSREALANILKVEKDSNFNLTVHANLDLQDTMRRTLLNEKKLPTCGCGYIYVHPTVTFSKHLADPSMLIGKQPGQENLAIFSKIQAMEYLNALRFFLEIVYETINK